MSIAAFDPLHVFKVPLPLPLQPYVREAATLCDGGYDPMWQVPLALLPAAVSLGDASGDALSGEALPPQGLVSDMTQGPDTSLSGLEWSYVGSSNPNPNPNPNPNLNPSPHLVQGVVRLLLQCYLRRAKVAVTHEDLVRG